MEALEKDILTILEADSRISAARLAAMLGISEKQAADECGRVEGGAQGERLTAIVTGV